MTTLDLTFTAPTMPLSVNRGNQTHWAARKRLLDPWKDAAWVTARNAIIRGQAGLIHTPGRTPVTVQVVLPFRTRQRRDAHNYTGTNVKAVVDGLVRAGIVPDDTPEWVTVLDPELAVIHKDEAPTVTIRIRPRETP